MISAISFVAGLALLALGIFWPPATPYITIKGAGVYEPILPWRVPIYLDRHWYIRWSWRDPVRFHAYCYDPEESRRWASEHPGTGMNTGIPPR